MDTDDPGTAILDPPTPDPRSITSPPQGWETTRDALHALAEDVIAPARFAVDGRIRLRWLPGGFGTPGFGADRQIRVEGAELVIVGEGTSRREPIAAVDPAATRWLGEFFAFGLAVLEDLRRHVAADEPVVCPEHFDYAIIAGDEAAGSRANYGAYPATSTTPSRISTSRRGWRATASSGTPTGFSGAELGLARCSRATIRAPWRSSSCSRAHAHLTRRREPRRSRRTTSASRRTRRSWRCARCGRAPRTGRCPDPPHPPARCSRRATAPRVSCRPPALR